MIKMRYFSALKNAATAWLLLSLAILPKQMEGLLTKNDINRFGKKKNGYAWNKYLKNWATFLHENRNHHEKEINNDIDVTKVRSDMEMFNVSIHLNNAGASPMPRPVMNAVLNHLRLEAQVGGYEAAARAEDQHKAVYCSIAHLLNCCPEEIALVESATVAWTRAFYSVKWQPGDKVLISSVEYAANYVAYLQIAKHKGICIEVVPSDPTGQIDVQALDSMIDNKVKAISLVHIPTNGGLVNPAVEVGKIARKHGILYVLDACQSLGQMPIDVQEIGCDILSGTGRKFLRGPRGTGFLFVRNETLKLLGEPPTIDHFGAPWVSREKYELLENAQRFEFWESNFAGRLGLGAAVNYALSIGLDKIQARIWNLSAHTRRRLSEIPGLKLWDMGENQCGIITFTVQNKDAFWVKDQLALQNIFVSVTQPSSSRIDAECRNLPALVRASVHYFNTEMEIDHFIGHMKQISEN